MTEVDEASLTAESATLPALPYVPFTSLINLLNRLREAGELPARIDRQFLGGSGNYQSQMLYALRHFELLGDGDAPKPALEKLALADDEARKPLIADLLQRHYADLFALGTNATQSQLEQAIRQHGQTGDTVRKVASHFLMAAKYADVPVSRFFKVPGRTAGPAANGGPRKRTAARRSKAADTTKNPAGTGSGNEAAGAAGRTVINLASGGQVTFGYTADLLVMSREDRDFVIGLVDQLRDYQEKHARPIAEPTPAAPVDAPEVPED